MFEQIAVESLTFAYSNHTLFEDAHFCFKKGQVYQLTGQNGSGKTTLLKILAGLIQLDTNPVWPNSDQSVEGMRQYHDQLIYIGHDSALKADLSVIQNLKYDALMHEHILNNAHLQAALVYWGLWESCNASISSLSYGQKRRVALCRLSLFPKQIWLLDEPFQGLDSLSCQNLVQLMDKNVQNQGIVVLSNHQTHGSPSFEQQVEIS